MRQKLSEAKDGDMVSILRTFVKENEDLRRRVTITEAVPLPFEPSEDNVIDRIVQNERLGDHGHRSMAEIFVVLGGTFELRAMKEGEDNWSSREVRAGDVIIVPPGIVHTFISKTDDCRLKVYTSAPFNESETFDRKLD